MKTVEIEGVQYKITATPPYLQHLLEVYGELAERHVETLEEAREVSRQQKEIMETIISETVLEPKPEPGHYTPLFQAVSQYTRELTEQYLDPRFFRPRPSEAGGKPKHHPPQETQRAAGDGGGQRLGETLGRRKGSGAGRRGAGNH
ncbi:MAG: hypothetical protein ACE5GD_09830 [Candidatus Geothermarchaeales archaeon]